MSGKLLNTRPTPMNEGEAVKMMNTLNNSEVPDNSGGFWAYHIVPGLDGFFYVEAIDEKGELVARW